MKKLLSIILTILMIVTVIPFTPVAFAAEGDTRTIYVDWDFGRHTGSFQKMFFDSMGNELPYEFEFVEDNFDLYRIPVDAASYWFDFSYNGTHEGAIPEKVDYYEAATKTWYCSHNMNTSGKQTCKGFLCEICGEFYGESASNAHDWSKLDGICANGCGAVCDHAGQTGVCTICGKNNAVAMLTLEGAQPEYFSTFEDAIDEARRSENEGALVTVLQDINFGGYGAVDFAYIEGGSFTIDLNGKKLNSPDLVFSLYKSEIDFIDSVGTAVVDGGEGYAIDAYNANANIYGGTYKGFCGIGAEAGTVIIDGANVKIENYNNWGYSGSAAIKATENGTITVKNSVISTAAEQTILCYDGSVINIEGGTISGSIYYVGGDVCLSGGTFLDGFAVDGVRINELSEFVKDGYAFYNSDGEVVSSSVKALSKACTVKEHTHSFTDSRCPCGYECCHENQTGSECEVCGKTLHTCDFSGEWKYDSEKHWKECSCGEISEEIAHTYLDGECECGFVCSHTDITVYGWDYCYTCGYIVAEEIAVDTPHTVTERHFVKFTPEVSGSYYFWSYDTTDGADPEGYVYEGNIFNYLDFIGSNKNFLYGNPAYNEITFEAELTAGKTYYFELFEYRKTQNGEPFEYTVMIKKICDNGAHSFTDSICDVCGYECFHPVATEGVCDNCGSACTHNKQNKVITVRPVQNDDGTWEKGTVEITCQVCGNTETKEVERDHEGYKTFDETAAKLEALINSDELIDSPKNSFTASLNNLKNSAYSQVYTEIESAIPSMTDGLNSIIATIEAGLANGTMKKADWTYMTAILDEIKALIDNDPNKIIPSMVGYYYGPNGFYSGSFGNPNYPQADYDRVMTEYGFKNQLETLLAGLKDGTALKADYTEIDEAIADIDEKLNDADLTDEAKTELEDIKAQLEAMKKNPLSSKKDAEDLMDAVEELDEAIEDGTIVLVDTYKILEEYDIARSDDLEEKYGREKVDVVFLKIHRKNPGVIESIWEYAESITGTVAETADEIEELKARVDALYAAIERCIIGTHNVEEYEVVSPAKCEANAIESGTCTLCVEVLTREVENSALKHSFTKYEVTEEAKCGVAGKEQAYCDNGCGEIEVRATEALKHIPLDAVKENEVDPECEKEGSYDLVVYCDLCGGEISRETFAVDALEHIFLNYIYNEDATCTADGTKTAICLNGCGETDTVTAEDTMLDHVDEDGDKHCDECENEIEETCPECGGAVHEGPYSQYICIIRMFIRLAVSLLRTLKQMYARV